MCHFSHKTCHMPANSLTVVTPATSEAPVSENVQGTGFWGCESSPQEEDLGMKRSFQEDL